jgi:glycosyltransferase involved in cell wall biosynthesis
MRALLVQPFGHHKGHPWAYSAYLSRALAEAGADIVLVTYDGLLDETGRQTNVSQISVVSQRGPLGLMARSINRALRLVRLFRPLIPLVETASTFLLAFREGKEREKNHANVLHVLDGSLTPASFVVLAAATRRRALALTLSHPPLERYVRGTSIELSRSVGGRLSLLSRLQSLTLPSSVADYLYRRAKAKNRIAFVAHSPYVQEAHVHAPFHEDIVCIPWGVGAFHDEKLTETEAREHLGLREIGTILLSFGVNHPRKDFEVIFQAVKDLRKDFTLLFAGDVLEQDKQYNDPRRFAEEYGWSAQTIVEDRHITERELPYYFHAADAIILSYKREFVGASGVLSLASEFGLPVIASDAGQLGEFVREFNLGLVFAAEDAESLREAICAFLCLDEDQRQEIGQNLQAFASAHSWREVAKQHLELYQSLSEGNLNGSKEMSQRGSC